MSGQRSIRLLLADDQDLVRGGLSALLSLEPDLEVVAEVGRGDQLPDAVREHRPDVALVDIEMPGSPEISDGIEAVRRVTSEGLAARCLIVTTFGRPGYLRRAMDAGAAGEGGSVRQVAAVLHLSQGTVRNHLSAAIGKTGAQNRHDAARIAREQGWV